MENDKSAIEILKEFAKQTNRKIDYCEKEYPITKIRPRLFIRQYAIISDKQDESILFINYADTKSLEEGAFFSGFFFPISSSVSSKIKIRKKDMLDKLNPFAKKSKYFDGTSDFEKKVVIEGVDVEETVKVLNNTDVQHFVLEALKLDGKLRVGISNIDLEKTPVKDQGPYFEIFMLGEWLLNDSIIEELFTITKRLRRFIK